MKSPMVENAAYVPEAEKSGYSELRVLSSAAGYYVGTMYTNVEPNGATWEEPGSRDSDYFRTHDAASIYLATVVGLNATEMLRDTP